MNDPVALITGATSGIGRVTALELSRRGWHVVLAVRNSDVRDALLLAFLQEVHDPARVTVINLDLSDLASVQQCAKKFLSLNLPLHALILNAGVAGQHGVTAQGYELAFGINHLGHFLLTELLTPKLCETPNSRVVTVASRAHHYARNGIHWDKVQRSTRSLWGIQAYAVSKLANIWFSNHLSRRLMGTGVSTYALHPGVVRTGIWRYAPSWTKPILAARPMLDANEGAKTTLYCTLEAPQSETGLYYVDGAAAKAASIAYSLDGAAMLWSKSKYFCRAFL
jgi:NAD(P)-dependent dehydrogenase (short-subunit alcohol dehydrogenase family)